MEPKFKVGDEVVLISPEAEDEGYRKMCSEWHLEWNEPTIIKEVTKNLIADGWVYRVSHGNWWLEKFIKLYKIIHYKQGEEYEHKA